MTYPVDSDGIELADAELDWTVVYEADRCAIALHDHAPLGMTSP